MNQRVEKIRQRLEAAKAVGLTRFNPELRESLKPSYQVSTDPYWPGIELVPKPGYTGAPVLLLQEDDTFATPEELEMFANAPADIAYLLSLFLNTDEA
jgi:hypothetical protein